MVPRETNDPRMALEHPKKVFMTPSNNNIAVGPPDIKVWQDSLKFRLESVKEAASRSRLAFIGTVITASSMCLVIFNLTLSWVRMFSRLNEPLNTGTVHAELLRRYLTEWVSTQVFTVPILGIRVMAADIPTVGPPALLVICLWHYFSVRREHFTTSRLLADVHRTFEKWKENPECATLCRTVYYGITAQLVLNPIWGDTP